MAEIHLKDIILGWEVDTAGKVSGNKIKLLEKALLLMRLIGSRSVKYFREAGFLKSEDQQRFTNLQKTVYKLQSKNLT